MRENLKIQKYLDSLTDSEIDHLEILSKPSSYRNKNLKFLQTITYNNQDIFFSMISGYLTANEEVEVNSIYRNKQTLRVNSLILGSSIWGIYFLNSLRKMTKTSGYFFRILNGMGLGIFFSVNYYSYKLNFINNELNFIFYNVVRRKIKRERTNLVKNTKNIL